MVSKRARYEVLRRDNFTCRYCGGKAPNVELEVDHVVPVALGGLDRPDNLATACVDCNAGKSSSTPDAALVADVATDEASWREALRLAAEREQDRLAARTELSWAFAEKWHALMPQFAYLGDGYVDSILRFADRGLTSDMLIYAVERAAESSHIPQRDRWRYFCGICHRMLDDLAEAATKIQRGDGA